MNKVCLQFFGYSLKLRKILKHLGMHGYETKLAKNWRNPFLADFGFVPAPSLECTRIWYFLNGLILRQNGKSQSPLIYIFNHACNWQKHFLFVVDVDQKLSQQLWRFEMDSVKHMPTDVSLSYNIYQNKLGITFIQLQPEFWIIFRRLVWHKIMPLN